MVKKVLIVILLVIIGFITLQTPEARAEYCFNTPSHPGRLKYLSTNEVTNCLVAVLVAPTLTPSATLEVAAIAFTLKIPNPFSGNINSIQDLFDATVTFLYFVAGPIVVIMIILSGLFFLFARDQADKITTAKRILTYALVGFAIILIGRGFIALIKSILALGG